MEIRPERQGDEEQIRSVVIEAFGSQMEGDLVAAIRSSPEYEPELALVAVERSVHRDRQLGDVEGAESTEEVRLVGHVMISRAAVRSDDGDRQILSLSPLAVASTHRRRGIGSALVRAALARADDRGESLVVLEGGPRFYGRLGFRPSTPLGITMELPDWAPPEAAQVYCLTRYDPAVRGEVVYSDAFRAVLDAWV